MVQDSETREDDDGCPRVRALTEKAWRRVVDGMADYHRGRRRMIFELLASRLRYKALLYPDHSAAFLHRAAHVEKHAAELDHDAVITGKDLSLPLFSLTENNS